MAVGDEYLLGTNGKEYLTIKRMPISISASGDNTVINAVSGNKIRILSGHFYAGGSVNITIKSGSTALTGAMPFAANGSWAGQFNPIGHWETNINEAFVINLSGAVQVSGYLN